MTCVSTAMIGWVALRSAHKAAGSSGGRTIFKAPLHVKRISRSVVRCGLCRAVSWYHCPNGAVHWSWIIKLCEQPSPNCFIVSEQDESRRGFFSMSTFCRTKHPPLPLLARPLPAWNKLTGHSDRPCSLRGINNTEVNPSPLHAVSHSTPSSSSLPLSFCFFISPSLHYSPRSVISLLKFALWKKNIKAQHQFEMSCETVKVTA